MMNMTLKEHLRLAISLLLLLCAYTMTRPRNSPFPKISYPPYVDGLSTNWILNGHLMQLSMLWPPYLCCKTSELPLLLAQIPYLNWIVFPDLHFPAPIIDIIALASPLHWWTPLPKSPHLAHLEVGANVRFVPLHDLLAKVPPGSPLLLEHPALFPICVWTIILDLQIAFLILWIGLKDTDLPSPRSSRCHGWIARGYILSVVVNEFRDAVLDHALAHSNIYKFQIPVFSVLALQNLMSLLSDSTHLCFLCTLMSCVFSLPTSEGGWCKVWLLYPCAKRWCR